MNEVPYSSKSLIKIKKNKVLLADPSLQLKLQTNKLTN
jgi:hypothetical protein